MSSEPSPCVFQSTYLTKNKEDVTQAHNAGNNANPVTTAETALASPSSNNTVPRNTGIVNNNISKNGGDNSENSDSQSGTKGITEPDISKDTRSHEERVAEMMGGKESQKVKGRKFVQSIGKALGVTVVFEDTVEKYGEWSDGYIDKNGVIHIDYNNKNPLAFLFRHEMVHYGSGSKFYKQFVNLVYKLKLFREWLQEKTKMPEGTSVDRMAAKYRTMVAESRKGVEELSETRLQEEMVADFAGGDLFTAGGSGLAAMSTEFDTKQRNVVSQYIADVISWLKKKTNKVPGAENLTFELSRLEDTFNRMISDAKQNPTDRELKHSIVTMPDGRKYVKADRQVIRGEDSSKWGGQVTNYINNSIRNGKDVIVYGADGDPLTITRDTAGKAQFRNYVTLPNGNKRLMTDEEYAVKLRAETHIDELSKVSKRGKKDIPDNKNHPFAKDGFNYRTAYFLDNDGNYYRITMSVGKNGNVNTVYNVGKIKETEHPDVAQRPDRVTTTEDELISVSNNRVSQKSSTVNNNSMQDSKNNSKSDIRRSVPVDSDIDTDTDTDNDIIADFQKLNNEFNKGNIEEETYMQQVAELYEEIVKKHGRIKPGEVGKTKYQDIPVPKRIDKKTKVQRHVRTILEGGELTDEMVSTVKADILSGEFNYTPTSNKKNIAYAEDAVMKGAAVGIWERAINGDGLPTATDIAVGEALLKLAVEHGNAAEVVKYTAELAELGTRLGQSVQALSTLRGAQGDGSLVLIKHKTVGINSDRFYFLPLVFLVIIYYNILLIGVVYLVERCY